MLRQLLRRPPLPHLPLPRLVQLGYLCWGLPTTAMMTMTTTTRHRRGLGFALVPATAVALAYRLRGVAVPVFGVPFVLWSV